MTSWKKHEKLHELRNNLKCSPNKIVLTSLLLSSKTSTNFAGNQPFKEKKALKLPLKEFKVNTKNTKTKSDICSKVKIMAQDQHQHCSGLVIASF